MKRILFAIIFVACLVGFTSLIPDMTNAQYPGPGTSTPHPTPAQPVSTPWPGLDLNYANCSRTSIEWDYRAQQHEVDYFIARATNGFTEYDFRASYYWGNQDVEYWIADYGELEYVLDGKEWSVQGIGYYPGYPGQEHYFTNTININCRLKRRVYVPRITKAR